MGSDERIPQVRTLLVARDASYLLEEGEGAREEREGERTIEKEVQRLAGAFLWSPPLETN